MLWKLAYYTPCPGAEKRQPQQPFATGFMKKPEGLHAALQALIEHIQDSRQGTAGYSSRREI